MLINYIKTAYRNILRNKTYAFINIAGLALGLAVFSLVASFTDFHFNFDDFHKNGGRVYCIVQIIPSGSDGARHSARTPLPLRSLLLKEFGEIEAATRWAPLDDFVVMAPGKNIYEPEGTAKAVDANFLDFFNFKVLAGDPGTALAEPNSIVLTESMAHKYFGNTDPIGRRLTLKLYADLDLKVTAVTEDVPLNSSLRYHLLVSLSTFKWHQAWHMECASFVRLTEKAKARELKNKLSGFIGQHMSGLEIRPKEMYLLALKDLHADSIHVRGVWWQDPKTVYLMTLSSGIALLLVVCFNFMSLATAQYLARTREVGIRKVVGGSRLQLMIQFLAESVLMALVAFALSIVLGELMYPKFAELVFSYAGPKPTGNPVVLLSVFLVAILVGIFAGSYPAFFLARMKSAEILKGVISKIKKGRGLRQVLVVSQFSISILLIVIAVLTIKQFDHLKRIDLGYNRERVYLARVGYGNYTPDLEAFKIELKRHPGIRAVSTASYIPVDWQTEFRIIPEGASEMQSWTWNGYGVDDDFIELLEMNVIKGRSFLQSRTEKKNFIINERAARLLPWDDPIGKGLRVRGKKGVIIGVVKDFHFRHIFFDAMPAVLYPGERSLNYLYIKLAGAPDPAVFKYIKARWDRFIPDLPFEYAALDEYFHRRYTFYRNLGVLGRNIGIFAVIFSSMGLMGLATYDTRRRTKEIGIRKAHGATVANIIRLFLVDFLRLIMVANIIALPVTYYAAKKLLKYSLPSFPMKIDIEIFIYVSAFSMVIAVGAVIVQTYKAAMANPVDSLRYE
jgi:putative ABC transport system permease protein